MFFLSISGVLSNFERQISFHRHYNRFPQVNGKTLFWAKAFFLKSSLFGPKITFWSISNRNASKHLKSIKLVLVANLVVQKRISAAFDLLVEKTSFMANSEFFL